MFALASVLKIVLGFAFGLAAYDIPSRAMMPTLDPGDVFIVDTAAYAPGRPGDTSGGPMPRVGDVALFRLPASGGTVFVKRVVGRPGDRVRMAEGVLVINGTPVTLERLPDDPVLSEGTVRYVEVLPDGRRHLILDAERGTANDDTPEFLVPDGHFFVLGDNRDVSRDSRDSAFGMVPESGLVGRAMVVVSSRSKDGRPRWTVRPVW